MSPLPNLRECDDDILAESPSDSEDTLATKFAERMRRRWEIREREEHEECEERKVRERAEREAQEARERAECEAREARERRVREEREQTACEEVRRGKVSAGRCV